MYNLNQVVIFFSFPYKNKTLEIFEDVTSKLRIEVSLDKLKLGWDIVEALVEIQAVASKSI